MDQWRVSLMEPALPIAHEPFLLLRVVTGSKPRKLYRIRICTVAVRRSGNVSRH